MIIINCWDCILFISTMFLLCCFRFD